MSSLVNVLSSNSKLLHLSGLKSAWECVIREPFKNATRTKSCAEDEKIAKAFVLLQMCPISTYLSLIGLVEECLRLNRPAMAAIFIAYVKAPEKEKIKILMKSHCNAKLKEEIIELEEYGVPPVITKSVIYYLEL